MKRLNHGASWILMAAVLLYGESLIADPVIIPNTFTSGTPAVADEVNGNFSAVAAAVNGNDARILALEAENAELKSFIDELRAVMSLQDDNQGNPAVVFSGVNVHVNNGLGATDSVNGLGNLIVGFDEPSQEEVFVCSDGQFNNEADCLANGGTFSDVHKTGSHTLVVGAGHNYSQAGGFLAGSDNAVTGSSASVSGGVGNLAAAVNSSVSGGSSNRVTGVFGSVSGGLGNIAAGDESSVSGGLNNVAAGNIASVSGGNENFARGGASIVSGGRNNTALSDFSSVSGGRDRTARGEDTWVAGDLTQEN